MTALQIGAKTIEHPQLCSKTAKKIPEYPGLHI